MQAMSSGGFVRSLHDRLLVDPVRRVVAQEMEQVTARLVAEFERSDRDLRRILTDMADADDQVAESIGRTLVRLSAEIELFRREWRGIEGGPDRPDEAR